jgi:uncharacterized protein
MSKDEIRYDLLVQDALRGVVRKVLTDAARNGLPGDHHFYITFRTDARGVKLSSRTLARFPEEMTIVLQHQFWDLSVSERAFEVALMFSGVTEKLVIPFDAVVGFSDPSVEFGLKFALQEPEPEVGANDETPMKKPGAKAQPKLPPRVADKPPRGAGSEPAEVKPAPQPRSVPATKQKSEKTDEAPAPAPEGDAKIISIDAFRKKT